MYGLNNPESRDFAEVVVRLQRGLVSVMGRGWAARCEVGLWVVMHDCFCWPSAIGAAGKIEDDATFRRNL